MEKVEKECLGLFKSRRSFPYVNFELEDWKLKHIEDLFVHVKFNEWYSDQARFTRKRSLIFECLFNDCTLSMIIPLYFYNIWTLTSSLSIFGVYTTFMCPPPPYFSFHLTLPCPLTSFATTPPFFLDRTLGHFNAIEVLMKHVSNFFQRLNSNANVSSLGQSKYHHNPISEERFDIKEFLLCTWCYLTWDHVKSSKDLRFFLIT